MGTCSITEAGKYFVVIDAFSEFNGVSLCVYVQESEETACTSLFSACGSNQDPCCADYVCDSSLGLCTPDRSVMWTFDSYSSSSTLPMPVSHAMYWIGGFIATMLTCIASLLCFAIC